jgi:hypothetical protein
MYKLILPLVTVRARAGRHDTAMLAARNAEELAWIEARTRAGE